MPDDPKNLQDAQSQLQALANESKRVSKRKITNKKTPRKPLTEAEKRSIVLDRVSGLTNSAVAKKYGISRALASKHYRDFMREATHAEIVQTPAEFREILKNKAFTAVQAGLDCETDQYRRATIGIQVLKGIGEFQPDQVLGVGQIIVNLPSEMREAFGLDSDGQLVDITPGK